MRHSKVLPLVASLSLTAAGIVEGCGDEASSGGGDAVDASTVDSSVPKPDGAKVDTGTGEGDAEPDTGGGDAGVDAPVFVLPDHPCIADGGLADARQVFEMGMVGCSGKVAWASRDELCNADAGCTSCSPTEWVERFDGAAPTHQYWTNAELRYAGAEDNCRVTLETGSGTFACSTGIPMRVCIDGDGGVVNSSYTNSSIDENGNLCNWTECRTYGSVSDAGDAGYDEDDGGDAAPNLHFGGCLGNDTAGTLCCCK